MLMTKEALKESYVIHNEKMQDFGFDYEWVWMLVVLTASVGCLMYIARGLRNASTKKFIIGLLFFILLFIVSVLVTATMEDKRQQVLQFESNVIIPYLFKNTETASTLKRYDDIDIQMIQDKVFNPGKNMGQVVVDDNGNKIVYPFGEIALGKTTSEDSYMEVNELDVALNEEYSKGKAFNVLYLNDEDYAMFEMPGQEVLIQIKK